MTRLQRLSEGMARKSTRRSLFGRGADLAFGALIGAAAGGVAGASRVSAGHFSTACAFPGPPCACDQCQSNGVCAKPCVILTTYYASGCWVAGHNGATCCDCDCLGNQGFESCGCGSDYHNDPAFCPQGNASSL